MKRELRLGALSVLARADGRVDGWEYGGVGVVAEGKLEIRNPNLETKSNIQKGKIRKRGIPKLMHGCRSNTPVDDRDYQVPFRFTGKLVKLTIKVDRPTLSPADIRKLEGAQATAVDGKPLTCVQPGPHSCCAVAECGTREHPMLRMSSQAGCFARMPEDEKKLMAAQRNNKTSE